MRELVDEALDGKNIEGDLDTAPGSAKLVGLGLPRIALADDRGIRDAGCPRNKVSFPIDAGAEAVYAGGAVEIMSEVVFAGPHELDRSPDTARDLESLVIIRFTEAAAQAIPQMP